MDIVWSAMGHEDRREGTGAFFLGGLPAQVCVAMLSLWYPHAYFISSDGPENLNAELNIKNFKSKIKTCKKQERRSKRRTQTNKQLPHFFVLWNPTRSNV